MDIGQRRLLNQQARRRGRVGGSTEATGGGASKISDLGAASLAELPGTGPDGTAAVGN